MWEIDLADQITTFLLSLPLGGFLSLLFYSGEVVRTIYGIKGFRLWISDILFFAFSGFITFCFLLSRSYGEIRGYIIFGIILGFWLFKTLLSGLYRKIFGGILRALKGAKTFLFKQIKQTMLKIFSKWQKSSKKLKDIEKKGLKKQE